MDFKLFVLELCKQLATGNFMVDVECQDDKIFEARVTGFSEEYESVSVEFVSDNLTKKANVKKYRSSLGSFGKKDEENAYYEWEDVPVKNEHINYKYIKLKP